jgi:hypothetical protein
LTAIPRPFYFSVFPIKDKTEIKLKGRHFDTTGVTEAELQAVLNTLSDHYFQDAFKGLLRG